MTGDSVGLPLHMCLAHTLLLQLLVCGIDMHTSQDSANRVTVIPPKIWQTNFSSKNF